VYRLCISYDLTILTELAVEPVAERKFNDAARQYFDVYAWLLPYRVSVMERTGNSAASKSVVPQESHKELKQTPAGAYKSTTSLDLSRSSTEPRKSRLACRNSGRGKGVLVASVSIWLRLFWSRLRHHL
jgi:hypothetical protein